MSSSNKTAFLGLNSWLGPDKPKMDDFNGDNRLIDSAFRVLQGLFDAHSGDASHITEEERERLGGIGGQTGTGIVTGNYTGNGALNGTVFERYARSVDLGFKPRFGVVFQVGARGEYGARGRLFELDPDYLVISMQWGFFADTGCSEGIGVYDTGFMVQNTDLNSPDGHTVRLNQPDVTYAYIALR